VARAYSVWVAVVNGKPTKAFTVKHELRSFLRELTGWNIVTIWKLPDGKHPLFAPKELTVREVLND
jgi:hypothetical protein